MTTISRDHRGRAFSRRAFCVIGATVTGLALPLGGLADHIHQGSPPSPGFEAWSAFHWSCGVLFTGFVVGHVVLNRKAYRRYLSDLIHRDPAASGRQRGSETVAGDRRKRNRRLLAVGATVTGLALPVSGLFDHLLQGSPDSPGFVLARTVHWGCAVLLMTLVAAHLWLNRKPYLRYLRELAARLPLLTREAGAVAALLVVILIPAVGHAFIG